MGKQKAPRRVAENEALAVGGQIRGSAQKLNLVAGLIRGKRAEEAMSILAFSPKAMARDVKKVRMLIASSARLHPRFLAQGDGSRRQEGARLGDRQCREQP